jgi:hypothetical protein
MAYRRQYRTIPNEETIRKPSPPTKGYRRPATWLRHVSRFTDEPTTEQEETIEKEKQP